MEDFESKYSGKQVEDLLDQVASGNAGGGGGGGITEEKDPVFSNSPAATITEEKIAEWDAKSKQGEKGDKGDTGVGVQSVAQTTTSNADGGSNVVTITLTDGTKSTFTIKNGSKGSQGVQGEQGPKGDKGDSGTNGTNGKDGDDGATFTPSVDSAGNLSWTNNKGLTNPPTVNIKGPKGDKGDAGEGGGGSSGSSEIETIYLESTFGESLVIDEMLAEKRYYIWLEEGGGEDAHKEVIFLGFEGHNADTIAIKHFYAVIGLGTNGSGPVKTTLCFPDDYPIYYPNGKVPEIAEEGGYELSITQVTEYGWSYYNVVVTPFG